MNYLAHAHLSFNRPGILTGNMISDYVKGKAQFNYPPLVQKGIRLHRAIDTFTDSHPVIKEMKEYYRPQYRLYAGAFCDVTCDHFLANDSNEFATEDQLQQFAAGVYASLGEQEDLLPDPFKKMFPWMQTQNWLYNYRSRRGIEKSFGGLVKRAAYITESTAAIEIFNASYSSLQLLYQQFYPEIKAFAASQLQQLLID